MCVLNKSRLVLLVVLLSVIPVFSQESDREVPPLRERMFYGGNIGLAFGTITDIEVSPLAGIWVLPRLGIAAGPTFRYYKHPYFGRTVIFGGRTYVEYMLIQDIDNIIPLGIHSGLFFHGEYELLSLETAFFDESFDSKRFLTGTFLIGGGISQYISQRSSLNLSFLWALNDAGYGIYSNPEIRISFIF
ncbi:MAG: hypothetical protein GYA41_05865 [Bacteroidales bacterium]|nr:hypothetical protein [Bacteroidales bacterium]